MLVIPMKVFSIPLLIMYAAAQGVDSDNGDNSDVGSGIPLLASPQQQSTDDHVSDQLPYI